MLKYDVVVVGGGPIGGFVAGKIAEKKYSVAVFEKNKQIGLPINCAGLVTPRVFEIVKNTEKETIQNKIKGANIHSPSNKILTIGGDKIHALAINRTNFDTEIIKEAKKQKAEIFLNNKVLSIQKNKEHYEITTSEKTNVRCKLLIGADGPFSKIRDILFSYQPKEYIKGIGAEITNTTLDPDYVEIFIGKKIAPGFFAWIIPTNKDGTNARIGLGIDQKTTQPPKYYLKKLFENRYLEPYIKNCEITKNIGGIIPLGVLKKTYNSNVMLVGDAAAQVKPTSGGGIYPGLICATHCANTAIEALEKNDFSPSFLKKYQKNWEKEIGFELKIGMKFRKIFKNLSDKQFNNIVEKFQDPKIIETINKYGDIDYPSKLLKPLLKKTPFLIRLLPNIVKK